MCLEKSLKLFICKNRKFIVVRKLGWVFSELAESSFPFLSRFPSALISTPLRTINNELMASPRFCMFWYVVMETALQHQSYFGTVLLTLNPLSNCTPVAYIEFRLN